MSDFLGRGFNFFIIPRKSQGGRRLKKQKMSLSFGLKKTIKKLEADGPPSKNKERRKTLMKEEKTNPSFPIPKESPKGLIEDFLASAKKLSLVKGNEGDKITLLQSHDRRTLSFYESDVEKVLKRKDYKGEAFLQVNFKSGKKILLTDEFVGFAPALCPDISSRRLPKVVTTADLLSLIEALEGSLYGTDQYQESLGDARLFFEAIASGAESIGFSLIGERLWVEKLIPKGAA